MSVTISGDSGISLASNATSATTSTNLSGGSAGTIPYQSASGTTVQLAAGSSGQYLKSNGAAAPSWTSLSVSGTLLNIRYFTTTGSTTYTPTSGTTFVVVEVLGAGGGGAGGYSGGMPGGGSGGYARKKITSSFSGVSITVGSGGAGGTNGGGGRGGTGGTTSFGALVSATGGAGGYWTGTQGGGGSGSGGDLNLTGQSNGSWVPLGWGTQGINYGAGTAGQTGPQDGQPGMQGICVVYEYA